MSKKKQRSKSSKKLNDRDQQEDPSSLPGWPGYRTRGGRSGYDPIDNRTEAAHMAGTILQTLFTRQIRNPIQLTLLGILGLVLLIPFILAVWDALNGNVLPWNAWIFLSIAGVAGLSILINFSRNLIRRIIR